MKEYSRAEEKRKQSRESVIRGNKKRVTGAGPKRCKHDWTAWSKNGSNSIQRTCNKCGNVQDYWKPHPWYPGNPVTLEQLMDGICPEDKHDFKYGWHHDRNHDKGMKRCHKCDLQERYNNGV